jgi:hypothetical protein
MLDVDLRFVQRSHALMKRTFMDNDNLNADKKPYEKPKLTRFPLRPEEAVLGFCKSTSAAGPAGGTCRVVVSCRTTGS